MFPQHNTAPEGLTHWGLVIAYGIILINTGSSNGLSPLLHQAITWISVDFRDKIRKFLFKKMHLNMLSAIFRSFSAGLNVLIHYKQACPFHIHLPVISLSALVAGYKSRFLSVTTRFMHSRKCIVSHHFILILILLKVIVSCRIFSCVYSVCICICKSICCDLFCRGYFFFFFIICRGYLPILFQGYYTGIACIGYDCPSVDGVNLNNMGKLIIKKQKQSLKHNSWDVLYCSLQNILMV